jgi:TPR repeat protein
MSVFIVLVIVVVVGYILIRKGKKKAEKRKAEAAVAAEKKKLEQSAHQGDVDAQYQLGERYRSDSDLDEAIEWFKMAAEKGHEKAKEVLSVVIADHESKLKAEKERILNGSYDPDMADLVQVYVAIVDVLRREGYKVSNDKSEHDCIESSVRKKDDTGNHSIGYLKLVIPRKVTEEYNYLSYAQATSFTNCYTSRFGKAPDIPNFVPQKKSQIIAYLCQWGMDKYLDENIYCSDATEFLTIVANLHKKLIV